MATLLEQVFGVGFLKVPASKFVAWNLRGDGEDWNPAAVIVVKSVDQM